MKEFAKTEGIKAIGKLHIQKFRNGVLIQAVETPNMIVTVGKQFILDRLINNTLPVMSRMAIGTGTDAPVSSDTTLQVEVARVGTAIPVRNNLTLTYTGIFNAGPTNGTGMISEAGIFNAASSGAMLARTSFTPIEKTDEDTLAISWHITLS